MNKPTTASEYAPEMVDLAFRNYKTIPLDGETILGEQASREVRVCGPGAFVILKALAFHNRGENKDAYDLFYLLRNFDSGIDAVAAELRPLLDDDIAIKALDMLDEDFATPDSISPKRVAHFLHGDSDADLQADASGFARELIRLLD